MQKSELYKFKEPLRHDRTGRDKMLHTYKLTNIINQVIFGLQNIIIGFE